MSNVPFVTTSVIGRESGHVDPVTSPGIPHTRKLVERSPGFPTSATDSQSKQFSQDSPFLHEMAGVFDLELHDEPTDRDDLSDDDIIEVEDRVEVSGPDGRPPKSGPASAGCPTRPRLSPLHSTSAQSA